MEHLNPDLRFIRASTESPGSGNHLKLSKVSNGGGTSDNNYRSMSAEIGRLRGATRSDAVPIGQLDGAANVNFQAVRTPNAARSQKAYHGEKPVGDWNNGTAFLPNDDLRKLSYSTDIRKASSANIDSISQKCDPHRTQQPMTPATYDHDGMQQASAAHSALQGQIFGSTAHGGYGQSLSSPSVVYGLGALGTPVQISPDQQQQHDDARQTEITASGNLLDLAVTSDLHPPARIGKIINVDTDKTRTKSHFPPRSSQGELASLLKTEGKSRLASSTIYVYKVDYTAMQHVPAEALRKTLHQRVKAWLNINGTNNIQVNNACYISAEDLNLDGVALGCVAMEPEELKERCKVLRYEEDFQRVKVGKKPDGTADWRKFFVGRAERIIHIPGQPDQSQVKAAVRNATRFADNPPSFAMRFIGSKIELTDFAMIARQTDNQTRDIVNAFIAAELRNKLISAGAEKVSQRGNRILANPTVLSTGTELWHGLKGSLTFGWNAQPELTWKPCQTHFLQATPVSEFILKYCGAESISPLPRLPLEKHERLTKVLRGVRVAVAALSHSKNIYTIQRLGQTARNTPEAINGTIAQANGRPLRYPDLPCIDVGTERKPFYLPAELCKVLPEQLLMFEPPVNELSSAFQTKIDLTSHGPAGRPSALKDIPPRKDIFKDVRPDEFELFFARITDSSGKAHPQSFPSSQAWHAFQHEIGERFEKKLREPCDRSKARDIILHSNTSRLLANVKKLVDHHERPHLVLIASVSKSVTLEAVQALKTFCDTQLGIHCCIVNANIINKRYDPLASQSLVQYTGQIVRKIFNHVLRPGLPDTANAQYSAVNLQTAATGRSSLMVGIHVVNLKDVLENATSNDMPMRLDDMFLVSIVSATPLANPQLHTSHHIRRVLPKRSSNGDGGQSLAFCESIASAMADHLNDQGAASWAYQLTRTAIYQTGVHKVHLDDDMSPYEKVLLDASANPHRMVFVNFSHETNVNMTGQDVLHLTDWRAALANVTKGNLKAPVEIQAELRNTFGLETLTLDSLFKRQVSGVTTSARPWSVMYQHLMSPEDAMEAFGADVQGTRAGTLQRHLKYECLEKLPISNITYLAQLASKRGRRHLHRIDNRNDAVAMGCPYAVAYISPRLRGTLYYL